MGEQPQYLDHDTLMKKVKEQGCRDSFHLLFKECFGNVVAYLKQSGVDDQKASELAQEVFVSIWQKSELFDPSKGTFRVWMYTIVRNLKFDHFRSSQRDILNLSAKDIYEDSEGFSDDFSYENLIRNTQIRDCVSELSQEQRDAVESIYFQGYSQSEYAELRKLPLGTVKSRIRLAFVQLRKKVEDK